MDKKSIIAIIVIVLVVTTIVFVRSGNKNNTSNDFQSVVTREEKININFEEYKLSLRKIFDEIEKSYQEAKEHYERTDFYNEVRIGMISSDKVSFVNLDDIDFENARIYNSSLEKIDFSKAQEIGASEQTENEEIKIPVKYGEQIVNLSDKNELKVNNYYLIRYQKADSSEYTVYFVGLLRNNGFEDFSVYCVTEGESFGNEVLE